MYAVHRSRFETRQKLSLARPPLCTARTRVRMRSLPLPCLARAVIHASQFLATRTESLAARRRRGRRTWSSCRSLSIRFRTPASPSQHANTQRTPKQDHSQPRARACKVPDNTASRRQDRAPCQGRHAREARAGARATDSPTAMQGGDMHRAGAGRANAPQIHRNHTGGEHSPPCPAWTQSHTFAGRAYRSPPTCCHTSRRRAGDTRPLSERPKQPWAFCRGVVRAVSSCPCTFHTPSPSSLRISNAPP
jgi:hypothetical protein